MSELTREEKINLRCTIEMTLDDIEYLCDALHSHKVLHQNLVKLSSQPVPWEGHLKMLEIGYEGERRSDLTKANLETTAHALKEGKNTDTMTIIPPKGNP